MHARGLRVFHLADHTVRPGARLAARAEIRRAKTLVEALVAVPLVIPPVATGLILLKLLGRREAIGSFLHGHLHFDLVLTGTRS